MSGCAEPGGHWGGFGADGEAIMDFTRLLGILHSSAVKCAVAVEQHDRGSGQRTAVTADGVGGLGGG